MASRVSVVLILWNSVRFLRRCAEGLRQQTEGIEVIVVDNASTDGSLSLLRELLPEAQVIENVDNQGFAAAANRGIAAAGRDFVLLLNPDVFLEPGYVAYCVDAMLEAGEEFGSATGTLLRGAGSEIQPTGLIDSTGIVMTRSGRHFDRLAGEPAAMAGHRVNEVFGVSGAAAVYRRKFLDDCSVGPDRPFDPDFFAYREDADLSWRGRLFGWRALHAPAAVAYHVRTVTPERRRTLSEVVNMHSVKNRFLLRLRNQGRHLAGRDFVPTFVRDVAVIGASMTIERSSFPALLWLLKNRASILAKRRLVQERRKVSDRELAVWFS